MLSLFVVSLGAYVQECGRMQLSKHQSLSKDLIFTANRKVANKQWMQNVLLSLVNAIQHKKKYIIVYIGRHHFEYLLLDNKLTNKLKSKFHRLISYHTELFIGKQTPFNQGLSMI
jgi:hypothetical protein